MRAIAKPLPGEYPPYASVYIDRIRSGGRLLEHLGTARESTAALILSLPEERLLHRYAPGKWSIKEVLVHIVDDERIYAYRALRFARGDGTELPGFDQDDYARRCGADARDVRNILAEYAAVRDATIALFNGLPEDTLMRSGVADGKRATVRALGYHIAGHEAHHIAILKERYLVGPG
jgi:uncharacterized damage-inducible protein DinB